MAKGGIHGKKARLLASQRKKKKKNNNNPFLSSKRAARKKKNQRGTATSDKGVGGGGGGGGLHEREIARASIAKSITLPSQSSRSSSSSRLGGGGGGGGGGGPPWQIMSNQDMKRNVKSEIERRQKVKSGELTSSSSSTSTVASTTTTGGEGGGQQQSKKADMKSTLLSPTLRTFVNWKRFHPDVVSGMAYLGSYLGKRLPPSLGVPEVAFLGRSNVGKSSLLNKLVEGVSKGGGKGGGGGGQDRGVGGGDVARVGKTPGATASVNLYALLGKGKGVRETVNKKPLLGLVDLPGFGYAKLSKEVKANVELAAERYLGKRNELALGILLVDARRIPSDDDRAVLAALYDRNVPIVVVATKIDKLSKTDVGPSLDVIRMGLGLPEGQPLSVSSVTGVGTRELWRIVLDAAEDRVEEVREELEGGTVRGGGEEYDTIPLDDNGNPLVEEYYEEEEEEEVEYDQGYDWIHSGGGTVVYEALGKEKDEDGAMWNDDDEEEEEGDIGGDRLRLENEERQAAERDAFKLKALKKAARSMERKGKL